MNFYRFLPLEMLKNLDLWYKLIIFNALNWYNNGSKSPINIKSEDPYLLRHKHLIEITNENRLQKFGRKKKFFECAGADLVKLSLKTFVRYVHGRTYVHSSVSFERNIEMWPEWSRFGSYIRYTYRTKYFICSEVRTYTLYCPFAVNVRYYRTEMSDCTYDNVCTYSYEHV